MSHHSYVHTNTRNPPGIAPSLMQCCLAPLELEVAILAVSIGTVPLQHLLTTVENDCSAKQQCCRKEGEKMGGCPRQVMALQAEKQGCKPCSARFSQNSVTLGPWKAKSTNPIGLQPKRGYLRHHLIVGVPHESYAFQCGSASGQKGHVGRHAEGDLHRRPYQIL